MNKEYIDNFSTDFLNLLEKQKRNPEMVKCYTKPIMLNNKYYGFEIEMINGNKRLNYFDGPKKQIISEKGTKVSPILLFSTILDHNNNIIYVCEGESDGFALLEQNKNVMILLGANSYSSIEKYSDLIREKLNSDNYRFRIVFDNDDAGRKGSLEVLKLLKNTFPNSSVLNFDWESYPFKDVREALNVENLSMSFFEDFFDNYLRNQLIEKLQPVEIELIPPLDYHRPSQALYFNFINDKENIFIEALDKIDLKTKIKIHFRSPIFPNYLERYDIEIFKSELYDKDYFFQIFKQIYNLIRKYVYAPNEYISLATSYVLLSYIYPIFNYVPYLYINGVKGSGKSTLANLITLLSFNGEHLTNPTIASFRRIIDGKRGLMSLDDIETLANDSSDSQEFRSQLNSGYETKAVTSLCSGEKNAIQYVYIGGPKIFNSINGLENVLSSRSIYLKMKPVNGKRLEKYSADDQVFAMLRTRALFWGLKCHRKITKISSEISLDNGRDSDLLLPLISIAKFFDEAYGSSEIEKDILKSFDISQNLKGVSRSFDQCLIEALSECWKEKGFKSSFEISNNLLVDKLIIFDDPCVPDNPQRIRTIIGRTLKQLDLEKSSRRDYDSKSRCTFYEIKTEILEHLIKKQSIHFSDGAATNDFGPLDSILSTSKNHEQIISLENNNE